MDKNFLWVIGTGIGAALAIAALLAVKRASRTRSRETPKATRSVIGVGAQPMYFRLCEALPEYIVLAEVAFSALLWAKTRTARSTFTQKRADFVVCDKAFRVVVVLELDDSTHDTKDAKANDNNRDTLLTQAGHRVLRYRSVPSSRQLRTDVLEVEKITRVNM